MMRHRTDFELPVGQGSHTVNRWPAASAASTDGAQSPGLLTAHGIAANGPSWAKVAEGLDPSRVPAQFVQDVNHYSILIGERGARAVARSIRAAFASVSAVEL